MVVTMTDNLLSILEEVRQYLVAAENGSMSSNNSQQLASELLERLNKNLQNNYVKIETGVMVIKNGKAWGVVYSDGRSTVNGWISPINAQISDPLTCTRPTDKTYSGSSDEEELSTAEVVHVERITELFIKK